MYATARLAPPVRKQAARADRRGLLSLLGPAFVTAVAYVDPGNFATNVAAGSRYGYLLVWVVLLSNVVAMLIQYLSAKAGIATGQSLPALCRDHAPRWLVWPLWAQAEIVAMATDLAEVVGGALALKLLFDVPMVAGGLVTAVVSFALLHLTQRGHRPFEMVIIGLLAVILLGFGYALVVSGLDPTHVVGGALPRFSGADSVLLAAGMVGATVMPHAIYLHGGLTSERVGGSAQQSPALLRSAVRAQRVDVVVAMSLAGLMNLAMLVVAAAALSGRHVVTIEAAHAGIGAALGRTVAVAFALALLASGLAASSVGTLAGQVVMDGFIRRRIPLGVRRLLTLLPALAVLAVGVEPTRALVVSQVVLSFGIPFALIPLIAFTGRADLMGPVRNHPLTTVVASLAGALIIALNVALLSAI